MNIAAKILKDIFTLANGEDYDIGRVLWALSFLVGLGLEVYCTVAVKAFNLQEFGIGVGALLVAGGYSLKVKASTEPGEKT